MQNLTALILAAGEGKRIKPIVTSKSLLPFLGQSLLDRVIHNLKTGGINKFLVVVRSQDKVKFSQYSTVVQPQPTGMAGAVLAARSVLVGPTVVVNGDDLIDPKIIKQVIQKIKKAPNQVTLTGLQSKNNLPGGYFNLQGPSLKVVEKPVGKPPSDWFKLVFDYFPKIEDLMAVLDSVKSNQDDVYEQALNLLPDLHLCQAQGYFQPLKYPWQILDLTQKLLENFKGRSLIDKTARIFPGAHIVNSYLGPNVIVGHNALIRDSIIEANTVIGYGTEIARSYVGPNNHFHSNYVGDSVIEGGSNCGAGAVLANLRFDHQPIGKSGKEKFGAVLGLESQLGVNVSLMPGVMIGSKAIVNSGLVVAKSLEAGEFKKN